MLARRFLSVALLLALLLGGLRGGSPAAGAAEVCFRGTDFCVQGRFLDYWQAHGGLPSNGFPLSDERRELLEDGREYTVQYFERVRLEHHPENPPPYDVLLGPVGRRILAEADLLATAPDLARLYLASERVQGRVGQPTGLATRAPGGYRACERGAMLWRGDTREIYVLCGGDLRAGDDVRGLFADTWREGDEPGRSFGTLWRENAAVRACLGYATEAAETASALAVQPYRRANVDNLLIGVGTLEGRVIYALYRHFLGSSSCITTPALCRPDYEQYPILAR